MMKEDNFILKYHFDGVIFKVVNFFYLLHGEYLNKEIMHNNELHKNYQIPIF